MTTYAHSKSGVPPSEWHKLEDHLRAVAERASHFAAAFGGASCGWYAGLWHDLGKYAADWQAFLESASSSEDASISDGEHARTRRRGPDHSSAGAIHARRTIPNPAFRKIVEFSIAGHHAGLADAVRLDDRLRDESKLDRYRLAADAADPSIMAIDHPADLPAFLHADGDIPKQKRTFELFTRMLFSALVDADFLDTENFLDVDGHRTTARAVLRQLDAYAAALERHISRVRSTTTAAAHVVEAREAVLAWCRAAAAGRRGVYTLTVPTGGGKTLTSLTFALEHALQHGMKRVVLALPFLSILDQTVQTFRDAFSSLGDDVVVEHHSNIVPERDTLRNRLAAENWDAPLIVTTQVQLFESLFARRSSDCRKLHNLAGSVIILDEVQTLPVGLLDPILDVLRQLTTNYGTTVVLTTATQPSLHERRIGASLFRGLSPEPVEIVPADRLQPLFDRLRRVDVTWPLVESPAMTWKELAQELAVHQEVLAIVHRRADAADLWRELQQIASGTIHLSALMCPAHRRTVLVDIRERLRRGEVCRVVSTQLVEAGVDVDFPVVYRAMAGLESLAQSAGRCNREGKLERGRFHVFRAPTQPVHSLRYHRDVAETMLKLDPELDLFAPATFRRYFDRLYAYNDRDARNVQSAREALQYEATSERFRMIPDVTETIFVAYGDAGRRAVEAFRFAGPSRERLRALQPFGVGIYPNALRTLQSRGAVDLLHDTIYVLTSSSDYDERLGLMVDREPFETLIA